MSTKKKFPYQGQFGVMYTSFIFSVRRAIINLRNRLPTNTTFLVIFRPFPLSLPINFRIVQVLKQGMENKL